MHNANQVPPPYQYQPQAYATQQQPVQYVTHSTQPIPTQGQPYPAQIPQGQPYPGQPQQGQPYTTQPPQEQQYATQSNQYYPEKGPENASQEDRQSPVETPMLETTLAVKERIQVENRLVGALMITFEVISLVCLFLNSLLPTFTCGYLFVECLELSEFTVIRVLFIISFVFLLFTLIAEFVGLCLRSFYFRNIYIRLFRLATLLIGYIALLTAIIVWTVFGDTYSYLFCLFVNILCLVAAIYMFTMHTQLSIASMDDESTTSLRIEKIITPVNPSPVNPPPANPPPFNPLSTQTECGNAISCSGNSNEKNNTLLKQ